MRRLSVIMGVHVSGQHAVIVHKEDTVNAAVIPVTVPTRFTKNKVITHTYHSLKSPAILPEL